MVFPIVSNCCPSEPARLRGLLSLRPRDFGTVVSYRPCYLVVAWTSSGPPIGVPYNLTAAANGETYRAHEFTFDMHFSIPETNLVTEGEVSSSVRGNINVEGTDPEGALGIFDAGA